LRAAVYRGLDQVVLEEVARPHVGPGEILMRVEACGICGTDLKKVAHGLVPPPRVFGHEMAGSVAEVGAGVTSLREGDRIAVVHHVPCRRCYLCAAGAYSQCETYKRTGTTAGFVPAGGGMAEYVLALDWIVRDGVTRLPDDVSFEAATFLEPANTCLKAVRRARVRPGEKALVLGQGSIGLLLLQLARLEGALAYGADFLDGRLAAATRLGATGTVNPATQDALEPVMAWTEGRGMDLVFVAAASTAAVEQALRLCRPGGRVMLFAQTEAGEVAQVNLGAVCVLEKSLLGSYSSSIDLQPEVEDLVFSGRLDVASLVTHRFGLEEVGRALRVASHPAEDSLKVVLLPHCSEGDAHAN
jgi:L-iditol 2-dehydrogenase